MSSARPKLAAVPDAEAPLDLAGDIYAKGREKREDREHWAKVHIRGDRAQPISLPDRIRGLFRR